MVQRWCLYDKKRSSLHNGLTYREARAIARILGPQERYDWYAWKEGWPQWKILNRVTELVATTTDIKQILETPPLPTDAHEKPATNTQSGVHLVEDDVVVRPVEEDGRKTDRIIGELSVEIVCQGRKFFSATRDISLKGVQLKDSVPDWMAGYCTLILSRPEVEQKLEFTCSIVENQELGKKFRLELQPSKDSLHLKRWLLDLHLQSLRKTTA